MLGGHKVVDFAIKDIEFEGVTGAVVGPGVEVGAAFKVVVDT